MLNRKFEKKRNDWNENDARKKKKLKRKKKRKNSNLLKRKC